MSVVVTRKDCSFSEANAFYRVESYNASIGATTTTVSVSLSLTAGRIIPLTFSNGGIFKGVVLGLYSANNLMIDRNILINLQENRGACTMPIASPGVVTYNGHGYVGGEEVFFTTTGTLPTGVVAGTRYFVKYINANTFNISATSGGSNINFTGTQTGTHYLWKTVASKIALPNEYFSEHGTSKNVNLGYRYYFLNDVNFTGFDNNVTVDTTSNKWMLNVFILGGTSGVPALWYGADVGTYSYYAYCDTQISLNDGDIPVFAHYCEIDKSFTTGCVLGSGETAYGIGGIICFNPNATSKEDVGYLTCLNPSAPYTLTLRGSILVNGRAGIKVGTPTARIPANKALTIIFSTPLLGTVSPRFFSSLGKSGTTYYLSGRASLLFYGEYPQTIGTYLSADAELLQNKINVTGDISSWSNGDEITIGWQNLIGLGEYKRYIIQAINGQEITLTTDITIGKRFAGGMVINITNTKFGVNLINNNTGVAGFFITNPNALVIDGAYCLGINYAGSASIRYFLDDYDVFLDNRFDNCSFEGNSVTNYVFCSAGIRIPRKNIYLNNWRGYRFQPNYPSSTSWVSNTSYKSGAVVWRNVNTMNSYAGYPGIGNELGDVDGFQNDNMRASYGFIMSGRVGTIIKNVKINGCSVYGLYMEFNALNNYIENIEVNQCSTGFIHSSTAISIGNTLKNITIGNKISCTSDYILLGYFDGILVDCSGFNVPNPAYPTLIDTIEGTSYRFVNKEDIPLNDVVWSIYGNIQRCGVGLADTTIYGTDKYSLRFESIGGKVEYCFDSPTGNIQGESKIISVQCKINSSNYWAGVYQLPKLVATYDDGTVLPCVAAQTTDWQKLFIPLETETGNPLVKVCVNSETDAVGSDSYVYFGHFDGGIPTPRNLDNRSEALPILDVGFITTTASSVKDAVMNADLSLYNSDGSFAKGVKIINQGIKKASKLIPHSQDI